MGPKCVCCMCTTTCCTVHPSHCCCICPCMHLPLYWNDSMWMLLSTAMLHATASSWALYAILHHSLQQAQNMKAGCNPPSTPEVMKGVVARWPRGHNLTPHGLCAGHGLPVGQPYSIGLGFVYKGRWSRMPHRMNKAILFLNTLFGKHIIILLFWIKRCLVWKKVPTWTPMLQQSWWKS